MSQLEACTAVMNGTGLAHAHATRLEAEAEFKDDRVDCLVEELKDMLQCACRSTSRSILEGGA